MPVNVNINNLTLCHKGSNGTSMATLPDVCKTPSPGGPVPIPYPNIAFSRDLTKGTKTIEADGGNMCANYGSEFCKSTGDEPGTVGGVKSGTFIKEATWITYSFDVKFEDKGACRLSDKMFHNHGNTVNASGLLQRLLQARTLLKQMVCDCDKEVKPGKDESCMSLGNKKHECVEKKKEEHNRKGGKPKLNGEKGYNYKTGKPDPHAKSRVERFKRMAELRGQIRQRQTFRTRGPRMAGPRGGGEGWALVGEGLLLLIEANQMEKMTAELNDIGKSLSGTVFPDGSIEGPDGKIEGFVDYKFGCPPGLKSGKGISKGDTTPTWREGQEEKMKQLLTAMKTNSPESIHPDAKAELITNESC